MTYEWFDGDPDTVTLEQAKRWLRARLETGAACPCCTQVAKEYKRKLNSGMCKSLLQMYRAGGATEFVDVTEVCIGGSREEGKLRYWGLATESDMLREDGGRAGFWRVTYAGEQFIRGEITLPSHVILYDGRFRGYAGAPVSIQQCIGDKFDLAELLGVAA